MGWMVEREAECEGEMKGRVRVGSEKDEVTGITMYLSIFLLFYFYF